MVGLTGGIGSGKSCRRRPAGRTRRPRHRLGPARPRGRGARHLGARRGRAGVRRWSADANGELDRPAMARLAFEDESVRRRLEQIIHPRVRARVADIVAQAPADAIVVNDVPLLVEAGLAGTFDLVVVVLASVETRIARVIARSGMAESDVRSRIAAQATDEQRRVCRRHRDRERRTRSRICTPRSTRPGGRRSCPGLRAARDRPEQRGPPATAGERVLRTTCVAPALIRCGAPYGALSRHRGCGP